MSKEMMPKEFIQKVLIDELGEIHVKYPYISFSTMAIGIEFLGKCLNEHPDWNHYAKGVPKADFERAIKELNSFTKYREHLDNYQIWDSLRNGFSHSFVPKKTINLSSKQQTPNLTKVGDAITLRCEDFYHDFSEACKEVIAMTSFPSGKMDRPLLKITSMDNNQNYSGSTHN